MHLLYQISPFLLATSLASSALAQPLEARSHAKANWDISDLKASCTSGDKSCLWSFKITASGSDKVPGFSAKCHAKDISAGDITLHKCTDLSNLAKNHPKLKSKNYNIEKLEAYLSLCKDKKNCRGSAPNQLHVKLSFNKGSTSDSNTYISEATEDKSFDFWMNGASALSLEPGDPFRE